MTYEEALEKIGYRTEILAGIGAHHEPMAAAKARLYALETLEALILAARAARRTLREERGYELYLAK